MNNVVNKVVITGSKTGVGFDLSTMLIPTRTILDISLQFTELGTLTLAPNIQYSDCPCPLILLVNYQPAIWFTWDEEQYKLAAGKGYDVVLLRLGQTFDVSENAVWTGYHLSGQVTGILPFGVELSMSIVKMAETIIS